jgi:hypothetical protein
MANTIESPGPHDFHVRLRRGQTGLREAYGRFEKARIAQTIDHVAIAAIEAAVWVRALSDLVERWETIERLRYRCRRDAFDGGADLVSGLRLAANLGLHQIVADQKWVTGEAGGEAASPTWQITWGAPSPSDRPGRVEREAYTKAVNGRDVGETLRRAAGILDTPLW